MSYMYKVQNLECANCAAKMETAVLKISGIKACTINFFSSKMKLETENEMTDDLFIQIQKIIKKIESGVKLTAI